MKITADEGVTTGICSIEQWLNKLFSHTHLLLVFNCRCTTWNKLCERKKAAEIADSALPSNEENGQSVENTYCKLPKKFQ